MTRHRAAFLIALGAGLSGCLSPEWGDLRPQMCAPALLTKTSLEQVLHTSGCGMGVFLRDMSLGENVVGVSLAPGVESSVGRQARAYVYAATMALLEQEPPAPSRPPDSDDSATVVPVPNLPPAPNPPPATWTIPDAPDVSGGTVLLNIAPDEQGGECRVIRQSITIKGEETFDDVKFCRLGPDKRWTLVEE